MDVIAEDRDGVIDLRRREKKKKNKTKNKKEWKRRGRERNELIGGVEGVEWY